MSLYWKACKSLPDTPQASKADVGVQGLSVELLGDDIDGDKVGIVELFEVER